MAEVKFTFWLLQIGGYTAFLWSLYDSLGDIKSLILFLVGLTFGIIKVYNALLDAQKKKFDNDDHYRAKRRERDLENVKVQKKLDDAGDNK